MSNNNDVKLSNINSLESNNIDTKHGNNVDEQRSITHVESSESDKNGNSHLCSFDDVSLVFKSRLGMSALNNKLSKVNTGKSGKKIQQLVSSTKWPEMMEAKFQAVMEISKCQTLLKQIDAYMSGRYDFQIMEEKAEDFLKCCRNYVFSVLLEIYDNYLERHNSFNRSIKTKIRENMTNALQNYVNGLKFIVRFDNFGMADSYNVSCYCRPRQDINIYLTQVDENGAHSNEDISSVFYGNFSSRSIYRIGNPKDYTFDVNQDPMEYCFNKNRMGYFMTHGDIFKKMNVTIPSSHYFGKLDISLLLFMEMKNYVEIFRLM